MTPELIKNWINGKETVADSDESIPKHNPHNDSVLYHAARSLKKDVDCAVDIAKKAQKKWANIPAVKRGEILLKIANTMRDRRDEIARVVAIETGKSPKEALDETIASIQLATFFAGEGMRLYGRSLQSDATNKYSHTIRQPLGVAGLIVAANTPIANIALKVFPALICGNSIVLKAAEDTPATALIVAKIAKDAGLPDGVLNIIQGLGAEAGMPIVEHKDIAVISFTGSTKVGRIIAETAGSRLARVSLELGGKNPLVVCDDADLENAVKWVILSSFSNAGQRCAASSRIIVLDKVYNKFRDMLVEKIKTLRVGNTNEDDLGAVINQRQLDNILNEIKEAESREARILIGGKRISNKGYYIEPTLIDRLPVQDELTNKELFGPVAVLYWARDFADALEIANASDYGLTACIHTKNIDRAIEFTQKVKAGTVNVNIGTYSSEPHYPFGGFGISGNGTRESGIEALDVYTETKTISFVSNPDAV
ncbi:MAG: aldehyde dehydrogenase [Alphaproteobacteria bacterium]|nr:aldehyde dehydrogenase [Alphaproteobacteria bacterium]